MKTQIDEFIERECDKPGRDYRNYINGFCEQSYIDGAHLLAPLLDEAMESLEKLEAGYAGMFGRQNISAKDEAWEMAPEIVSKTLQSIKKKLGVSDE